MPLDQTGRAPEYAINVADLTTVEGPLLWLLQNVIPGGHEQHKLRVVEAEKGRVDGLAAILECGPERAEAIVQIARKQYGKNALRFYRSEGGTTWKRV